MMNQMFLSTLVLLVAATANATNLRRGLQIGNFMEEDCQRDPMLVAACSNIEAPCDNYVNCPQRCWPNQCYALDSNSQYNGNAYGGDEERVGGLELETEEEEKEEEEEEPEVEEEEEEEESVDACDLTAQGFEFYANKDTPLNKVEAVEGLNINIPTIVLRQGPEELATMAKDCISDSKCPGFFTDARLKVAMSEDILDVTEMYEGECQGLYLRVSEV